MYCYVMIGRSRLSVPGRRLVNFVRWHSNLERRPKEPEPLMKFNVPYCFHEWASRDVWAVSDEDNNSLYVSCKYSANRDHVDAVKDWLEAERTNYISTGGQV